MPTKPKPVPEDVIARLRAVRDLLTDEDVPMTAAQRRDLRDRMKRTQPSFEAAMSAIGMSKKVSATIGVSSADVADLLEKQRRWTAVEEDLRSFLNGVSSANLLRRHQLGQIADHVFAITKQLVRWPENEVLINIYEEMKRLRTLERQKKRTRKPKGEPEPETTS
jgi:hypothetical protein